MVEPGRRGGGRALLVGDRVGGHAALRAALAWTREVARVAEAADLRSGVALAAGADVVVVDAELVVDAGIAEAIGALRSHPSLPEVVVAARDADPWLLRETLSAGARSFLLLGPDVAQARSTIEAALDGRGMVGVEVVHPLLDDHPSLGGDEGARRREVVESLAAAVDAKDAVTSAHLRNVTRLAVGLAALVDPRMAADADFVVGCLLHDVGKLGVPERILQKPGPLTEAEWTVMRRHPSTGADVVAPLGLSGTVLDIVRHHHERWDGDGYPDRLGGEDIPLSARIFSVCDALEAMTADRPYRIALDLQRAVGRVRADAGRQFDPLVVQRLDEGLRRDALPLATAAGGDVPVA